MIRMAEITSNINLMKENTFFLVGHWVPLSLDLCHVHCNNQ